MRRSRNDKQIIKNENGEFIGICFGYDYCCEHECGSKLLYEMFGVPGPNKKVQGVKARTITKIDPERLTLRSFRGTKSTPASTVLIWNRYFAQNNESKIPNELLPMNNDDWTAAWSSGPGTPDFGLCFPKDADSVLQDLYDAFQRNDIAIMFAGSSNPFAGNGLVLAIASKVPAEVNEMLIEADLDKIRLEKAAEKTGVKKLLEKAQETSGSGWYKKCGYYALSPSWVSNNMAKATKYPVMFYLNPQDQKNNNSGWYTVEELKQWPDGKGPIPKTRMN